MGNSTSIDASSPSQAESTLRKDSHEGDRLLPKGHDANVTYRYYLAVAGLFQEVAPAEFQADTSVAVLKGGSLEAVYASDLQGTGATLGRPTVMAEVRHPLTLPSAGRLAAYAFAPLSDFFEEPSGNAIDPAGTTRPPLGLAEIPGTWTFVADDYKAGDGAQRVALLAMDLPVLSE